MTVHDRIKLVVKWLIGSGVANNQEAIGRLMGYSNKSSFSQILNNKVPIPNDFIGRLCTLNENINKVWIEKGMGDMVVDMSTPTSTFGNVEDIPNIVPTQSDTIVLRLIDKLDEKDTLLKEKDAKIDLLQSELRSMEKELATLKAKYPEAATNPPKGLGPSETAPHAPSHPHSPTSEHYYGGSCPPHQDNQ